MEASAPENVFNLLSLSSAAASSSTSAAALASSSHLSRRGLHNVHNTCFLNCVLQCLLHCPSFFDTTMRMHAALQSIAPALEAIDDTSGAQAQVQHHHHAGGGSQTTGAAAGDVANAIPITYELIVFAAHCRRKERAAQQQQRPQQQRIQTAEQEAESKESAAPVPLSDATSSSLAAAVSVPASSSDAAAAASAAGSASVAASAAANPSATEPPVAIVAPSQPSKNKKKKKAGAGAGVDRDSAFLDALLRKQQEEEERKLARETKKKQPKVAAASQPLPPTQSSVDLAVDGSDEVLAEALVDLQLSAAVAPGAPDVSLAALADAATVVQPKKKKHKKKKTGAAAAAGAATATTAATDGAEEEKESTAAAADETETVPVEAADEPIAAAAVEPTSTIEPEEELVEVVSAAPLPPKKQQRVHRVEDEEEWDVMPKKGATKQQPKQKAAAAKAVQAKAQPSKADSSATAAASVALSSPPPSLGVAPTTVPFLPSFPRLLRAFHSHRQGQQEDAQELLQILCENVQEEWNRWTAPWRAAASSSSSLGLEAAASATTLGNSADDWNEVGKGSKAIKVTSNLSFVHTPLSLLFCGRVRTQLSVQHRATDTMSFQPFWTLHLDIDEVPSAASLEAAAMNFGSGAAKAQARHRRKAPVMSVEKALERYMCPSEISGYKKKGAPPPPQPTVDSYYGGYAQPAPAASTTRALHMHALDSHSLPKILVLHLKRFEQIDIGGNVRGQQQLHKSLKHVQFHRRLYLPPKYLSTAAAAVAAASSSPSAAASAGVQYDLCGVVVHHGHSMLGGHYTAFVRDTEASMAAAAAAAPDAKQAQPMQQQSKDNKSKQSKQTAARPSASSDRSDDESDDDSSERKTSASSRSSADASASIDRDVWFHCDDSRIIPVAAHTVYSQAAYLLFYTLNQQT